MPGLFDPITVRTTEIRNRIWVAPMCQYSCLDRDGVPTDWHLVHLGSFARGGAGLVIAEATAVVPEGRISPEDAGLWSDEQEAAWARIAGFIRAQGAVPGIQLAHAGRKASTFSPWGDERQGSVPLEEGGWTSVAPSAVAFDGYAEPRALAASELPALVAAFADAARRAVRAGFGLVEVHAAHGYLLHQFLSPLSNLRDDAYGGSLENRARLLLEVVRAVREAVGDDFPVLVRFSGTDWAEGGWDAEQTSTVAGWAREAGADLFDISSGGLVAHQRIVLGPGYQVPLAAQIGADADVPVAAVGLLTEPAQADAVIREGRADAVLMGREFLRDPHFPLRAAVALGVDVPYWPAQYLRAKPRP
jgi:2,4-dienoyl-CoA reductase-like NADH-dependent reductase (Old Yellow Enzyme family)